MRHPILQIKFPHDKNKCRYDIVLIKFVGNHERAIMGVVFRLHLDYRVVKAGLNQLSNFRWVHNDGFTIQMGSSFAMPCHIRVDRGGAAQCNRKPRRIPTPVYRLRNVY